LDRELKDYFLVCELLVHGGECVELGLYVNLVLGVQKYLKDLAAIDLAASALANNLSGVHEVLKNGFLYGSESTAARSGGARLAARGGAVEAKS
jgi:hypothetical protein